MHLRTSVKENGTILYQLWLSINNSLSEVMLFLLNLSNDALLSPSIFLLYLKKSNNWGKIVSVSAGKVGHNPIRRMEIYPWSWTVQLWRIGGACVTMAPWQKSVCNPSLKILSYPVYTIHSVDDILL